MTESEFIWWLRGYLDAFEIGPHPEQSIELVEDVLEKLDSIHQNPQVPQNYPVVNIPTVWVDPPEPNWGYRPYAPSGSVTYTTANTKGDMET